jgi:hypothetical protein
MKREWRPTAEWQEQIWRLLDSAAAIASGESKSDGVVWQNELLAQALREMRRHKLSRQLNQ